MKRKIPFSCLFLCVFSLFSVRAAEHVYCVVLAGGSGERLWPLSRQDRPKQLLVVGQQKTLIRQAIDRVSPFIPSEHIFISTTQQHEEAIRHEVGNNVGKIFVEPGARDTGPAILLSCFEVYKDDPEAVIVFVPADPFIPEKDYAVFGDALQRAITFAHEHDRITLLGVTPAYPATGYGYIEYEKPKESAAPGPYPVTRFREKPSAEVAQQYVEAHNMLWNIGMFCAKVSVFMHEFKQKSPAIFEGITHYINGQMAYDAIQKESIDYAIMEKSKRISVMPVDISWCDVGNVDVFLRICEAYGVREQNSITVNAKNNLIDAPGKLVALVGVDDLCVVESDDIILITKASEAEQVRAVVKQLKQGERVAYL